MQSDLSPTLDDKEYYGDEYELPNLKRLLVPMDDEANEDKVKQLKYLNLKQIKPEVANERRK